MPTAEPARVYLDDRIGSKHLQKPLEKLGCDVVVKRLPFADAMVLGEGERGRPVSVGIELKRTGDLLRCISDGRFAGGQLPGLLEHYEVNYLVVEGEWKRGHDGQLLTPTKGVYEPVNFGERLWMFDAVEHWLQTMENVVGLHVRRTQDKAATAELVGSIASWWDRPWDSHNAHLALDNSRRLPKRRRERMELRKPSTLRLVANVLPGVGWKRSKDVDAAFDNVQALANADVDAWKKIPGIGKTTAARVVAAIKGE